MAPICVDVKVPACVAVRADMSPVLIPAMDVTVRFGMTVASAVKSAELSAAIWLVVSPAAATVEMAARSVELKVPIAVAVIPPI